MRRMSGGVLLGLAALLVGLVLGLGCATANAQAWPEKYYSVPSMSAVNDTVCSAAGWRDTVYISDYVDAPAGTMHIAVDWKSVWSWTVECPPDDNDVGVWVWVLPAFNSVETDSFLVRQNTAWSQLVPVKAWYIRGANATADSCARYQIVFDGEPPAN